MLEKERCCDILVIINSQKLSIVLLPKKSEGVFEVSLIQNWFREDNGVQKYGYRE